MFTDLYLIKKYWTHNKKQLMKVILSVVILAAMLVVTISIEKTERRREYDGYLHGHNACDLIFKDVPDKAYETLSNYPETERSSRVFIYGRLGIPGSSYIYGSYENDEAEALDYLPLTVGRLPRHSGEAAIYDHSLRDMFPGEDTEDLLDREITLEEYDLENNKTGERSLRIVGVIKKHYNRRPIESYEFLDPNIIEVPMPMIFLSREDTQDMPAAYNYALVKIYGSEYETVEAYENWEAFELKCSKELGIEFAEEGGISVAASGVMRYQAGNPLYEKVYDTDTTIIINYFCILAVIISAISLFGVLFTVMQERIKSLKLIKTLGYSNARLSRLLLIEWIILYITGFAAGIGAGVIIYELILFAQKSIWGLAPLQAFQSEWAVDQVTADPFLVAFICSFITFLAGYIFLAVKFFVFGKNNSVSRKKERSLGRIKKLLSGDKFTNIIQISAFTLVIFTATAFYSFFSINGKGIDPIKNPEYAILTRGELVGDSYYQYGGINMKRENIDHCIYSSGASGSNGPMIIVNDSGMTQEAINDIEKIDGLDEVCAYGRHLTNIVYPEDNEERPAILNNFRVDLPEGMDVYGDLQNLSFYQLRMILCSSGAVNRLSEYVTEGEIGSVRNGITIVLSERNKKAEIYKIGDTVSFMAVKASKDQWHIEESSEYEAVVEAIAVIPDYIPGTDSFDLSVFFDDRGVYIACTQDLGAETFQHCYDRTFIRYSDGYSPATLSKEIRSFIKPSMNVEYKNIEECTKEFNRSRIESFLSIIIVLIMLVVMTIVGYYSLIAVKVQKNKSNIAVMRALGLTKKRSRLMFIWNNLKNTLVSCIISGALICALRAFLSGKYNEAAAIYGQRYSTDEVLSYDKLIEIEQSGTELIKKYLLDYEMHKVPVLPFFIFVAVFLMIVTVLTAAMITRSELKNNLSDELADKGRE